MPTDTELLNWMEKSWRTTWKCPVELDEDETNDFERTFYGFVPRNNLVRLGDGVFTNAGSALPFDLSLREALTIAMKKDTMED